MIDNSNIAPMIVSPNLGDTAKNIIMRFVQQEDKKENMSPEMYFENDMQNEHMQSPNLYYMLYDNDVAALTQKQNSSSNIMQHTIDMNFKRSANQNRAVTSKSIAAINKMKTYREAIRSGVGTSTVIHMDLETLGGVNEFGTETIDQVYEYAFTFNVVKNGKIDTKTLSGLIGISEKNIRNALDQIESAYVPNQTFKSDKERLMFEYIARIGDVGTKISKLSDSAWKIDELSSRSPNEFLTAENFSRGKKILYDLGDAQKAEAVNGLNSGVKQMLDSMVEAQKSDGIIVGHNIKNFDIPVIKNIFMKNPGAKKYADKIGLNIETLFGEENVYDSLNIIHSSSRADLFKYIDQGFYGGNTSQLNGNIYAGESFQKAMNLTGSGYHTSEGDNLVNAKFIGTMPADGKFLDHMSNLEDSIIENYQKTPLEKISVGGLYYAQNGINMYRYDNTTFGYIKDMEDNVTFYNGKELNIKNRTSSFKDNSGYATSASKKGMTYKLNNISLIESDELDEIIGSKTYKKGSGKYYRVSMSPFIGENSKYGYMSKSNSEIVHFVQEENLQEFMAKNFVNVANNNKITEAGEKLLQNMITINSNGEVVESNLSGLDVFEKINDNKFKDTAIRNLRSGKVTAYKGADIIHALSRSTGKSIIDINKAIKEQDYSVLSGQTLSTSMESSKNLGLKSTPNDIFNFFKYNEVLNPKQIDNATAFAQSINPDSVGFYVYDTYRNTFGDRWQKHGNDILKEMTNVVREKLLDGENGKLVEKILGTQTTPILKNDTYHLPAGNLFNILNASDKIKRTNVPQYVDISMNANPNTLIESLKQQFGYSSYGFNEQQKKSMLITMMLKSEDKDLITAAKTFSNRNIKDYSSFDIAAQLQNTIYQKRENNILSGRKPTTIDDALESVMFSADKNTMIELFGKNKIDDLYSDDLKKDLIRTGKAIEKNTFISSESNASQRKVVEDKIRSIVSISEEDYRQQIKSFPQELQKILLGKYHIARSSQDIMINSIVGNMPKGAEIRVDSLNNIFSIIHNGKTLDLSQNFPHLISQNGVIQYRLNGTSYIPTDRIEVSKIGKIDKIGSLVLEKAKQNFDGLNQKLKKDVYDSPLDVISKALKNTAEAVRENPQANKNIMANMQSLVNIDVVSAVKDLPTLLDRIKDDTKSHKILSEYIQRMQKGKKNISFETMNVEEKTAFMVKIPEMFNIKYNGIGDDFSKKLKFYSSGKATKMSEGNVSLYQLDFGASWLTDPSRDIENQRRNLLIFNGKATSIELAEYIKKLNNDKIRASVGGGLTTSMGEALKSIRLGPGEKTANELRLTTYEGNSASILDRVSLFLKHNENLETIGRIFGHKAQTIEGSALLAAGVADSLRIHPGTTRVKANKNVVTDKKILDAMDYTVSLSDTGELNFSYGNGIFIDNKNSSIVEVAGYGNAIEENPVKAPSTVKKSFLLKNTKFTVDPEIVKKEVYEKAEELGVRIKNQSDFIKIAQKIYDEGYVSTPIEAANTLKTISGQAEKSMAKVNYIGVENYIDSSIKEFFNSEPLQQFYKKAGIDLRKTVLRKDLYDDISAGTFQSPFFNKLNKEEARNEIKSLFNTIDIFKERMEKARYVGDEVLTGALGALYVSSHAQESIKHGTYSGFVQNLYLRLSSKFEAEEQAKNPGRNSSINRKIAEQKAAKAMQQTLVGSDSLLSVTDSGELILPEKAAFDSKKMLEVAISNGLANNENDAIDVLVPKIGSTFEGTVGILEDAFHLNNKVRMSEREIMNMSNMIITQKDVDDAKTILSNADFNKLYGDIVDENYILKNKNTPFLASSTKEMLLENQLFAEGQEEYDRSKIINKASQHKIKTMDEMYKRAKELKYHNVALELLDEQYAYQSHINAFKYMTGNIGEDELIENGFKKIGVKEVFADVKNNADFLTDFAKEESLLGNNFLIDLTDENLGIGTSFLTDESNSYKNISKIAVPADVVRRLGDSAVLSDIQKQVSQLQQKRIYVEEITKGIKAGKNTIEELNDAKQAYKKQAIEFNEVLSTQVKNRKTELAKSGKSFYDPMSKMYENFVTDSSMISHPVVKKDYEKMEINGRSLIEWRKIGVNHDYAIIGSAELDTYGINDEYFEKIGISKDEWLKKAKTEGIWGIVSRQPMDYAESNTPTKIFINDDIAGTNQLSVSEKLAARLKADSDGDKVRIQLMNSSTSAYGSKKYIDELSLKMINNGNNVSKEIIDINARTEKKRNEYSRLELKNSIANEEIGKTIEKSEEDLNILKQDMFKSEMEAIDGIIAPEDLEMHDNEKLWSSLNRAMGRVEQQFIKNNESSYKNLKSMAERNEYVMEYLKNNSEDLFSKGEINKAEFETLNTIKNSDQAFFTTLIKMRKTGVGSADTPLYVVNKLTNVFKNQGEITAKESLTVAYAQEMIKEGFLSAKKENAGVARYYDLTKDFVDNLNNLMTRGENWKQSKEDLTNMISTYGRMINNKSSEIFKEFETDSERKEAIAHRFTSLVERMTEDKNARGKIVEQLFNLEERDPNTGITIGNPDSLENKLYYLRTGKKAEVKLSMGEKIAENAITDTANSAEKKSLKAGSYTEIKDVVGNLSVKGKIGTSAKVAAGIASALMFAGYAGGNPSVPASTQAQQQSNQESYQFKEIPKLSDTSYNAMNNGPKNGYIINLQAKTTDEQEYARDVISQALATNFQNTNINIAMNVNNTSNIQNKDILTYLEQVF